jgi:hypothetical protein
MYHKTVKIEFEFLEDLVLRFKITKLNDEDKFEIPIDLSKSRKKSKNPRYEIEISEDTLDSFSFKIIRKSTNTVM